MLWFLELLMRMGWVVVVVVVEVTEGEAKVEEGV
jgi:hypothetical protein